MSFGKAAHALRKSIMFDMAAKCGMDSCFRCGAVIESAAELSIDHKESWLYVNPELFWDLNNIAFSHRSCNTTDRPMFPKKNFPREGESWCSSCKSSKPKDEFGARKCGSGTAAHCNLCRRARGWGHGNRRFPRSNYLLHMTDETEASAFERLGNGESLRVVAKSYCVNHETLRKRFLISGVSIKGKS